MTEKVSVPENLQPMFRQMMSLAPDELCHDVQFQRSILLYLKLGGAKLARQHIQVVTKPFCKEFGIVKKQPDEIADDEQGTENKSNEDAADSSGNEPVN